ncbi:prostaglandin E receptor 1c (subtype EP1) [Thalassophryne amazonica]|uniref:prostaglandin E receptor 1c (subtype EP1) n=1 Tax=Thalassophryne amazonica TaxID=390379 RepID=UPI00147206E5|nr:prostaglandin E receptor 1c (subtype EP1) [Thalassophryne amazonica]
MTTPSALMGTFTSSTPSITHYNLKINTSEYPNSVGSHISTVLSVRSSGFVISCFTMSFGTISNLTALVILAKSHMRCRRQAKATFLLLVGALLLVDLGGHVILGAFALYLHTNHNKSDKITTQTLKPVKAFCQIFGASMVFFGLCPLLLGCAMAVERCVGITQPLFHAAVVTVTHVRRVVLFLPSLALVLAILPLLSVGTYTPQFPGTWCFLPIHGSRSTTDANLVLVFSCVGLIALALSLLCNIVSGLVLLQARIKAKTTKTNSAAHCIRRSSSLSSSSFIFCSLDVEMMVQLAVITVVSCVCWSPFLIHILVVQFNQSSITLTQQPDQFILLGLRMACWNQILDPWVYILLRRAVLYKVCCGPRSTMIARRSFVGSIGSSKKVVMVTNMTPEV